MIGVLLSRIREWSCVGSSTYLHEEDEVFEGGVEVRLLPQLHHLGEVLVVDVRVHAEQTLQDRLRHREEVLGERHACNTRDTSHDASSRPTTMELRIVGGNAYARSQVNWVSPTPSIGSITLKPEW